MQRPPFLPVLRELARCYQAFESYSATHVREIGLTPSQFDIIATLGNTDGMSFTELGARTLITKGTLTGVVDRLVARRLARRVASPSDGRSQIVQLTASGEAMFRRVFPEHLRHLDLAFRGLPTEWLGQLENGLRELRGAFELAAAHGPSVEPASPRSRPRRARARLPARTGSAR